MTPYFCCQALLLCSLSQPLHLPLYTTDCPPRPPPHPPCPRLSTGDLLEGVDMAPLHRCVHIHACLGRLPSLQVRQGECRLHARA